MKSIHNKNIELDKTVSNTEKPTLFRLFRRELIIGFLLFTATLLSYHPAWNGQPIWDDDHHITSHNLRSTEGLVRIWTQPGATQQYYPLVHSVFWLEHRFWGDTPIGYHLLNILLHILSAFLLVRILRFLQIPGAWLAGAIFALHPIQVESVAWITELKNTLSGLFFLSSALVYLMFDQKRKKQFYAISLSLFIFGLLSKSVIAILPVSLLAVFWWKRGKIDWKRDVIPLVPFFVIGIASGLFTAWMERKFIGAEGNEFTITFIERCLIAGRVVWFYLGKIIWPVDLIFIYPRWHVSQAIWWQYLFPVATLLLAAALWTVRRRWRAPFAMFICYIAAIFPVMGFFNVYPFRFSFVADHFQYLAIIGPIAIVVAAMNWAVRSVKEFSRFLKPAGILILLLTLSILTWRQSRMYSNAESLYRTTIRKNESYWMAYNNLGLLLEKSGRTNDALTCYRKALEIYPDYAEARNNLGNILFQARQTDEAIVQYQKVLEINPNYTVTYNNLGVLLAKTGRYDDAIANYRKALEISPDYAESHNNIGLVLAKIGRTDEAMAHYKRALEINPGYYEAHKNIGTLLEKMGQTSEAVDHYRKAVEINLDYSEAQYNYGNALVNAGRTNEALSHYLKAIELNPDYGDAHYNLGIALVSAGRIDQAIVHFQKAVEINPHYYEAHYNLGNAFLQTGHTDEAIAHYKKALEIHPDNVITLHNLAVALAKKGQLADALRLLEKASDLVRASKDESMNKTIAEKIKLFSKASR